jgi:hypothetical protein
MAHDVASRSTAGTFHRISMAYRRGQVFAALRRRTRPYLLGAGNLLTSTSLELHHPCFVAPDPQDLPLVRRLLAAFRKMKAEQPFVSALYRPTPFWQGIIDQYPLTDSAADDFLSNFGVWETDLGIAHGSMMTGMMRNAITRRYAAQLFDTQMRTWRSQSNRPTLSLSYPRHGNQPGAFKDGQFIGLGSFDNETYGVELSRGLPAEPIVAELGAGHGKLAYFILRDIEKFTYIDFDLPETLTVAAYYLIKTFPGKKALLYGEADFSSEYDLIFMPPWKMTKLTTVDLFVNTNSLGEMKRDAAANYLSHINRTARRFFHLNHERAPQDGRDGLRAPDYPLPNLTLAWKQQDLWNVLFQGRDSDIFGYLYQRR